MPEKNTESVCLFFLNQSLNSAKCTLQVGQISLSYISNIRVNVLDTRKELGRSTCKFVSVPKMLGMCHSGK